MINFDLDKRAPRGHARHYLIQCDWDTDSCEENRNDDNVLTKIKVSARLKKETFPCDMWGKLFALLWIFMIIPKMEWASHAI